VAENYNQAFAAFKNVTLPILKDNRTSAWAQYTLQVPNRDNVQKELQKLGVPTAVHYPRTMADQPAYQENGRVISQDAARELAQTVLSLPMYPDMTEQIQAQVIKGVTQVLG
jgi:UDP-2-acetamido-2-deoxy-ribo-hexuluronate aminotransferase